jgi:hypothetical protein
LAKLSETERLQEAAKKAAAEAKKAAVEAEKDKAAATEADKDKDEGGETAAKAAAAQPKAAADEAQASQSKLRIYSQPVGGNQHAAASKFEISKAEWEVAVKGKYGWKLKGKNKWATRAGPTKCECDSHSRIKKKIEGAIDKEEEFCRKCDKEEDGPVPVAPGVAFSKKNGENGVVKRAEIDVVTVTIDGKDDPIKGDNIISYFDGPVPAEGENFKRKNGKKGVVKRVEKDVVTVTVNGEDIKIQNDDIISYFIPAWTKADLQVYLVLWQALFLWSARTGV